MPLVHSIVVRQTLASTFLTGFISQFEKQKSDLEFGLLRNILNPSAATTLRELSLNNLTKNLPFVMHL